MNNEAQIERMSIPKSLKSNDVAPDVTIELTTQQKAKIAELVERRDFFGRGMIFGSVGLCGETIGLSFIPQEIGEQIRDFANQELGGENDADS